MDPLFPLYWRCLGLPISRAKGAVVDWVPFSLVECVVWAGLACSLAIIYAWVSGWWPRLKARPPLLWALTAGPAILILLTVNQGAFPWSLAPSAWRLPLAKTFPAGPLAEREFRDEVRLRENRLLANFSPAYYQSLSEGEVLHGCDLALDRVLEDLGLPKGRAVRRIKAMGPLTTLLGLSYGGPAFHDPFLGELAMVKQRDLPSPRYWRLLGVCHETAHAKGFTREMDAEILTQLALSLSPDPRYRLLGDIMYLRKTGEKVHYPEFIKQEILFSRERRKEAERRQWGVRFCRKLAERMGFQNSGGKYGTRESFEAWNPSHPFFSTVAHLLARLPRTPVVHEP